MLKIRNMIFQNAQITILDFGESQNCKTVEISTMSKMDPPRNFGGGATSFTEFGL